MMAYRFPVQLPAGGYAVHHLIHKALQEGLSGLPVLLCVVVLLDTNQLLEQMPGLKSPSPLA